VQSCALLGSCRRSNAAALCRRVEARAASSFSLLLVQAACWRLGLCRAWGAEATHIVHSSIGAMLRSGIHCTACRVCVWDVGCG
jgi:hypothetical protein